MFGLLWLHWGLISQNINISGADPASGVLTNVEGSGVIIPRVASGKVDGVSRSSRKKGVSGSSSTGRVGRGC